MSRTKKHEYSCGNKPGRGNTYGLCYCRNCRRGRSGGKNWSVRLIKRRWRRAWKLGREFIKGLYTD